MQFVLRHCRAAAAAFVIAAASLAAAEDPAVPVAAAPDGTTVLQDAMFAGGEDSIQFFRKWKEREEKFLANVVVPDLSLFSNKEKIAYATTSRVTRTTCAVLAKLAEDSDPEVRLAAALNYYTPYGVIRWLGATDSDERVRTAARENAVYARTGLELDSAEPLEPWVFRYEELHAVVEARERDQMEEVRRLDGFRLRTYGTAAEATADLDRMLSSWETRPLAALIAFTNAVDQVRAMRRDNGRSEETTAFFGEAMLRTIQLDVPTNLLLQVQREYFGWRDLMIRKAGGLGAIEAPAALAPKLADLCAAARAKRDELGRMRDEWREKEPRHAAGWENHRAETAWWDRLLFLEERHRWASSDRATLHDWLFRGFTQNWYSEGLKGLTPEMRRDAYRALVRRADADPKLDFAIHAAYERESFAREMAEASPFLESDRVAPGDYRTIAEARKDLARIFAGWEKHPESTADAGCGAVDQVLAMAAGSNADSEADAFLREYVLRTFQLTFPTNLSPAAQQFSFDQARRLREHVWSGTKGRLPASLAPRLADLCARARTRRDALDEMRNALRETETSEENADASSDDLEAQRKQADRLLRQFRWAECEWRTLHEWLFLQFTNNWYSRALAGLTPEVRYCAYLALLRRANVEPGAMESLGDTARGAYRRETQAWKPPFSDIPEPDMYADESDAFWTKVERGEAL